MSVKKVFLIRHGETDYNRDGRLQGAMPVPLNDHGRLQAQALGLHLKRHSIDAIYTSPLPRAYETAELMAQILNVPLLDDTRLQEIGFGQFEGLPYTKIKVQYANEYRMWNSGDMLYAVPGGEARRSVQLRMTEAWDDVTTRNDFETIALVSHGAAIKILLRHMFYRAPSDVVRNTSVTTLSRFHDVWEIESYAQTPHLND